MHHVLLTRKHVTVEVVGSAVTLTIGQRGYIADIPPSQVLFGRVQIYREHSYQTGKFNFGQQVTQANLLI